MIFFQNMWNECWNEAGTFYLCTIYNFQCMSHGTNGTNITHDW